MPKRKPNRKRIASTSNSLLVEAISLTEIREHPRNVRVHDDTNISAIVRSLAEFGQRTPIVINVKGEVLKGNGTLRAATQLGWSTIQAVRATSLTPEQELAYMLADNKTSDLSEFDAVGLGGILRELNEQEIDLSITGFQEFEMKPLLAEYVPPDPGEEPDVPDRGLRLVFTEDQTTIIRKACDRYNRLHEELRVVDVLTELARQYIKPRLKQKEE